MFQESLVFQDPTCQLRVTMPGDSLVVSCALLPEGSHMALHSRSMKLPKYFLGQSGVHERIR